MSYLFLEDFRNGVDSRRSRFTLPAGALVTGNNVHLTRGGELETRKAFVQHLNLTGYGSVGLYADSSGLMSFGSAAEPAGWPSAIQYQRLQDLDGGTLVKIRDATLFDGKAYVIAEYNNGNVWPFYDGEIIEAFHDGLVRNNGASGMRSYFVDLLNAHDLVTVEGFVITSGTNTFDVEGPVDVDFTLIARSINPDTGATVSYDEDTGTGGDMEVARITTAGGGAKTKYTVTISTAVASNRALTIFIDYIGDEYRFGAHQVAGVKPTSCVTLKGKVYVAANTATFFSALNDVTDYEDILATAGFINMANEFAGADTIVGLGVYQNNLVTLARRQAFIHFVDSDPSFNRLLQPLNNTGTIAEGSVVSFGDLDSFYLSDTGVRSLRARDSSNTAAVSDIGTPIDTLIVEAIRTLSEDEYSAAQAIIEPVDGRYMLVLGGTFYNFTSFPSSKISAWTTYATAFGATAFATLQNRVYVRGDDDKVYLYGGADNDTYEAMDDCEVILPYLDAKSPALEKKFNGIDAALEGEWDIYISTNTQEPDRYERVATWNSVTYDLGRIPIAAVGTHISVKFKHRGAEYGRIGNVSIHYDGDEAD